MEEDVAAGRGASSWGLDDSPPLKGLFKKKSLRSKGFSAWGNR